MAERKQLPLAKSTITAVSVVGEMMLGGLFLENLKMEKQRTSLPYPQLARGILKQGIKGFENGLVPWGLILGLSKGFVLGGSRVELEYQCRRVGMSDKKADVVSGFGAGAVQGIFMSPLLLARTRVNKALTERALAGQTTDTLREEIAHSTRVLADVVKTEGWTSLLDGMGVCMLKRSLDWGSRFIFVGKVKEAFAHDDGTPLTDAEKLASSFLGGAFSVLVTMPVDRTLPLLQQGHSEHGEGVITMMKQKLKNEGYGTLFRGVGVRTIHTGWHTMFALFVADKIYQKYNSRN